MSKNNYYYLLSYAGTPIGIYNKMAYLMDYLLEISHWPKYNMRIRSVKIFKMEINKGYPIEEYHFDYSDTKKLLFLEKNNNRVDMNDETFNKFIKIKHIYSYKNQDATNDENKTTDTSTNSQPMSDTQLAQINKSKQELEEQQKLIAEENSKNRHELNMLINKQKHFNRWMTKFDHDVELYNKFVNLLDNDPEFIIPELFLPVYNLFKDKGTDSFPDYYMTFYEESDYDIEELMDLLQIDNNNTDDENGLNDYESTSNTSNTSDDEADNKINNDGNILTL